MSASSAIPRPPPTWGSPATTTAWSDYSPSGLADQVAHVRRTIAALHAAAPSDERENTAKEAMLERLGLEVELYDAHITPSRVSVIGGQAQEIRAIFDLMPTDTEDAWRNIAARLRTVDQPLDQVRETLARRGPGGQHLRRPADQGHHRPDPDLDRARSATTTSSPGWSRRVRPTDSPAAAARRPGPAADRARQAFSDFADWLGDSLAPLAPSLDAVGEERYALDSTLLPRRGDRSRGDLPVGIRGTAPDPGRCSGPSPRTWSASRTSRRRTRRWTPTPRAGCIGCRSSSGPGCRIWPTGRSPTWPARTSTSRIRSRRIECCIAPTHDGSIYYTDPGRGLLPARADVVGGAGGDRHLLHLEGGDHGLPRGCARASPADRPERLPVRPAEPLAAQAVLLLRAQRGLGAVRRAADG